MKNEHYFSQDSHLNEDGIFLFVDALKLGVLDELPAVMRIHVETCLRCKQEILSLYDITEGQDYESLRPHPIFDQKKIIPRFFYSTITRLAAAILIGSGLALFVYFNLIREADSPVTEDYIPKEEVIPDQIQEETERESEDQPHTYPPTDLYAANFEPSPLYEGLVAQPFRSYGLRIYAPVSGTEVTDTIEFRWDTTYRGNMTLRILSNRESEIFRTPVASPAYTYIHRHEPGLYYWRLETDQELLYVDKFVVPIQ
jgi:hypothetical protein